jgi:hypothetical protein
MKKAHVITLVICVLVVGFLTGATFVQQGTQNHKLGFGSVISADSTGSIALSSCDGMSSVDADRACQIGTGSNADDDTVQYRGSKLPLVTVDTNTTTTTTAYQPVMLGEILVGNTNSVGAAWISVGLTTNDWRQI